MESSTSRVENDKRKREALMKQMAALQSELAQLPETAPEMATPSSPKRKAPEPTFLAPATPSPKKKQKFEHRPVLQTVNKLHLSSATASSSTRTLAKRAANSEASLNSRSLQQTSSSGPSTFLSKLATLGKGHNDELCGREDEVARSTAFTDAPSAPEQPLEKPKRDEILALVEELEPGPIDHKPPFDDPHFEHLEPNSGIRLSSRLVSHDDFQDHLRGRFYLSPSRLYSCIRLLPDKQGYEVPVPGDLVTIAVVAERGPIKYSRAPIGVGNDEHGQGSEHKGKGKEPSQKPSGKKYVNLKLIDFGSRSRTAAGSSTSVTGGKNVIRGDAFLTLLLFEADHFELVSLPDEDGEKSGKMKKVYKGGSGGAFEAMSKVKEGDVIALLNPKILKPFQRSTDKPHPTSNILAITPSSASSILTLGRSKDLGMCAVLKRDGKPCGSWCDKRVSDVCEYHVQVAVERRRSSRPEFSVGTTGMSTSAAPKRKPAFDSQRQWGLLPPSSASSSTTFSAPAATYVVSGHVVSSGVSEAMGREGQARAQRKLQAHESDRALKKLLRRDKEGMRAVLAAREVGSSGKCEKAKSRKGGKGDRGGKGDDSSSSRSKAKGKDKAKAETASTQEESSSEDDDDETTSKNGARSKPAYSAEVIKKLGFDPTAKLTQPKGGGIDAVKRKMETLAALQSSRKVEDIDLRPRNGLKILSNVRAPPQTEPHEGRPRALGSVDRKPAKPCSTGELASTSGPDLEPGMIDLDDF
ncbi:hypothetical protein HGRIS_006916 [Hohenbuehelia grisea]|uniref:Zinc finger Mcm10/DnaG-type domain-containing protein n=1 Tax=Hohenbuehelia grisea TaxID=104357 RepID=A0ABR3JAT2_9AGAR